MNYIQLLGLAAGALTTSSLVPQVLKSIKSRSTKDVSLGMFVLISIGNFLWFIYGLIKADIPVIAANIVTFILAVSLIVLKLKYR